jgi:tetratricopeptide (TPR) repeat protein
MRIHLTILFAAALTALGLARAQEAAGQHAEPILEALGVPADRAAWRTFPADSARVFSAARGAQSRYEITRRNHLPWTWGYGGGRCDERIGRFCLWHSDGDSRWQPPPDPEPVTSARGTLIARLDTAAAVVPGDAWVAGQRVRYLVEAGELDGAIAAAQACRADSAGWCDALLGLALHARGDHVRADSAFGAALDRMPDRERERWTDLAPLLEADALRAYRRLDEAGRADFEATYWWLANPFHMLPGNDRRTEHFARHVYDRLQDRARQTEGISWGADLRQLLVRYGTPAGWERIRPTGPSLDAGSILTRYRSGSRHFDPPLAYVRDPFGIGEREWDLKPRMSRTGYAPPYAAPVEPLEYLVTTARRADSVLVIAALRMEADSLGRRAEADAALVAWRDRDAPPLIQRSRTGERPAVLSTMLPAEPVLVSLEAVATDTARGGRERFALALAPPPPHGLSASDLLLFDEVDPLPADIEAALPAARSSLAVRAGERLGLFWELYGLSRADLPVAIDIRLVEADAGWLRRAAIRAGIVREHAPLSVRWLEEPVLNDEIHPRSVVVEIPAVSPGSYVLQVTLTPRGREAIRLERVLEVEP